MWALLLRMGRDARRTGRMLPSCAALLILAPGLCQAGILTPCSESQSTALLAQSPGDSSPGTRDLEAGLFVDDQSSGSERLLPIESENEPAENLPPEEPMRDVAVAISGFGNGFGNNGGLDSQSSRGRSPSRSNSSAAAFCHDVATRGVGSTFLRRSEGPAILPEPRTGRLLDPPRAT